MASAFSHAVAALSIGTAFCRPGISKHVWVAGALCSVIPDLDVIGFRFGISYGDFWVIVDLPIRSRSLRFWPPQ